MNSVEAPEEEESSEESSESSEESSEEEWEGHRKFLSLVGEDVNGIWVPDTFIRESRQTKVLSRITFKMEKCRKIQCVFIFL